MDTPIEISYVKCLQCTKDSPETKEMETWYNQTNGYTWHICEDCTDIIEAAIDEGELQYCTECEMPCNYDELYTIEYHDNGNFCDDCYDKIWHNASKEAVEACQVFTHKSHIETYGTGFPAHSKATNTVKHGYSEDTAAKNTKIASSTHSNTK